MALGEGADSLSQALSTPKELLSAHKWGKLKKCEKGKIVGGGN